MRAAISVSRNKDCGLKVVCEVAGVARSSVYARRQAAKATVGVARRRGPRTPWSDAELVERIRAVLADSPFVGEGYRKVWAKLRFAGIRTSKDRVLRLMREHGLQAPRRCRGPRGPRLHDGTIIPEGKRSRSGVIPLTIHSL